MLRVSRDGSKVVVDLDHGLRVEARAIRLAWSCGSDVTAAALVQAIELHVEATIAAVRRLEYEAGWNDHRTQRRKDRARRKPKRTWFRGNLVREAP